MTGTGGRQPNLLIIHRSSQYPMRVSVKDHLYSFRRHSGCNCAYVDLLFRRLPKWLSRFPIDTVIFHTTFLSGRWTPSLFEELTRKVEPLKDTAAVKVVLPQDEFLCADLLVGFINRLGVDHVFSVAPESEWPKIYRGVDFEKVRFHRVLTGYLEQTTLERIERLRGSGGERPIDIGYRAWHAAPWLGRHGRLKTEIADIFSREAPKRGLSVDISTRSEDTLLGEDWYRFLLRCRYTIGVEGGASVLDRDGSIRQRTESYVADHPSAPFEEVEDACFPGLDGQFGLVALSPRHLEACATRTCQILIEGEYNGILEPWTHFVPLKRDFSDLDRVLSLLSNEAMRTQIVERAYADVVASGGNTYQSFVDFVLESVFAEGEVRQRSSLTALRARVLCVESAFADQLSRLAPILYRRCLMPLLRILSRVSPQAAASLRSGIRRLARRAP
jgi:hypothetical protein